jgi:AraC-like DNA-binding protein
MPPGAAEPSGPSTALVRPEWVFEFTNALQASLAVEGDPDEASPAQRATAAWPPEGPAETAYAVALLSRSEVERRRWAARRTNPPILSSASDEVREADTASSEAAIKAGVMVRDSPNQQWTLDAIARTAHRNRTDLQRAFRRHWIYSIHTYLVMSRIESAKRLLRTTAWRLEEVAKAVGYRSKVSLHRNFRLMTGMTPDEYRRRWHHQPVPPMVSNRLKSAVSTSERVR